MEATLTRTLCQYCGAITTVAGWSTCDKCMTDEVHFIPIVHVADVIMMMDMQGTSEADRQAYFKLYGVTPMQVAAAEEEVESRYKAAKGTMPHVPQRRNRYRGWQ